MKRKSLYSFGTLLIITIGFLSIVGFENPEDDFSVMAKTTLREAGHQLLLSNNDSTSLVLPVELVDASTYRLSFENTLAIQPNSLVDVVDESLQKATFYDRYSVEVIQCTDEEVAYSYVITDQVENNIVPCSGRTLPKSCYTVEVKFTQNKASLFSKPIIWTLVLLGILAWFLELFYFRKKNELVIQPDSSSNTTIGNFTLSTEQHKLTIGTEEIKLSVKECELLSIFAENPNQVITRETLTKKVWEDNGVVVGRSLDTYISKLRKKLKADDSIRITNVHGVGYKLEV